MALTASWCGEEDDGEGNWHVLALSFYDEYAFSCFAAAYRFPQIRSAKLKEVQRGIREEL